MPELPEVEAALRTIAPAMLGARFVDVLQRRPDLRMPFPRDFSRRLVGQTVTTLTRRAKYLVAGLSSGETLLMHLGMSGSFGLERSGGEHHHIETDEYDPHDHVVFLMSSGWIVTFNDPRRFGLMDLVGAGAATSHQALASLGPEPLAAEFDGAVLARALRGRKTPVKVALLDQGIVAGLGNIYASEALSLARISPRRRASTLATPTGRPRPAADRLAAAIKHVLQRAVERQTNPDRYRSAEFRVYDREGRRCPNRGCAGTIRRLTQAGRSTFYCPTCQR
jgi:formamidopyrimidine-DNA glycosylase